MALERVRKVTEQILNRVVAVRGRGEEATKQALVLPMLDALGYDIWSPDEVCPEYDADFAIRKAGQKEKVDIAILLEKTPRIYIEVKPIDECLDGHEGQLARYFNATQTVALGVLTNGIEWRFFTDTGDPNVMDSQPFHVAKLDATDQGLDVMARFAKGAFCAEAIRDSATELIYTARIAAFLRAELDLKDRDASEYLIRWILKSDRMYDGTVNLNVVDRFRPITKAALARVLREVVRRSIAAMDEEAAQAQNPQPPPQPCEPPPQALAGSVSPAAAVTEADSQRPDIVTTEKELKVLEIVKGIWANSVLAGATIFDPSQRRDVPATLSAKDTTGYFGIYLNKPAWWAIRVVAEARRPWIGFCLSEAELTALLPPGAGVEVLAPSPWAAARVAFTSPEDLAKLAPVVIAAFQRVIADRKAGRDLPQGVPPAQA